MRGSEKVKILMKNIIKTQQKKLFWVNNLIDKKEKNSTSLQGAYPKGLSASIQFRPQRLLKIHKIIIILYTKSLYKIVN